jgi:hypothetical protein
VILLFQVQLNVLYRMTLAAGQYSTLPFDTSHDTDFSLYALVSNNYLLMIRVVEESVPDIIIGKYSF